jgi:hypothetical protein
MADSFTPDGPLFDYTLDVLYPNDGGHAVESGWATAGTLAKLLREQADEIERYVVPSVTAESSTTPADPREQPQSVMLRAAERAPKVLPPRIARNIDEELRTFVKNWDVTQGIHGSLFPRLVDHHLTVAREVLSLPDTEGVASLRASGTPVEAIADALKDMRLNLTPHALEAIHGGANHLILTDAERHDIALTALKALGLEGP